MEMIRNQVGLTPAGQGAPIEKWTLLRAVELARVPLGLKGTSLSILRALLTFMKSDHIDDQAPENHVVFASNARIAERAHVSIQTVERHISTLASAGLLRRATASNGKRWARRGRAGQFTVISGLSVLPILEQFHQLVATGIQYQEEQDALKDLRDRCVLALAHASQSLQLKAKQILRRRPHRETLERLLLSLNSSDADTQNEGHKEQSSNPNCSKKDEISPADLEAALPELCERLRYVSNANQALDQVAQELGCGRVWLDLYDLTPSGRFILLGHMLRKIHKIQNPAGYMKAMAIRLKEGTISLHGLVYP